MSFRATWAWLLAAAGLFGVIYFLHNYNRGAKNGPAPLLPHFDPKQVAIVQVRPAGQVEIRAQRTNGGWELIEPLAYPAQALSIENLLTALQNLAAPPAIYIPGTELRSRPTAEEEFGLAVPQSFIILEPGDIHIRIGKVTGPGDQVYLQVIGNPGAYVVSSDLLKFLPRNSGDWRDRTLLNFQDLPFDRLSVSSAGKSFELQVDGTNGLWRIAQPFPPARADLKHVDDLLQNLQALRIQQFISDDPKADLDAFGLQNPELQMAFAQGTNTLAVLQFSKAVTNDAHQVFARRLGKPTIVTVRSELLAGAREPVDAFRDPHLILLTRPVDSIEVRSGNAFRLERQPDQTWRVLPEGFAADTNLVESFVFALSSLKASELVRGVVAPPELPEFGLAKPVREYVLGAVQTNGAGSVTNLELAHLNFGLGTNSPGKVFVRRGDESTVFALKAADFERLPALAWQLRDRKLFSFGTNDLAAVTVQQGSKVRKIVRTASGAWSLAPGSQGIVDDLAVEQTMDEFVRAFAVIWTGLGEANCPGFGITNGSPQITVELRNGKSMPVRFGAEAASGNRFMALPFGEQVWICEFPWAIYRDLASFLLIR
jgi:Domain of unknown function (DUF4340)